MKKTVILTLLLSCGLITGCSINGTETQHTHVGQGSYVSDETNHWKLCECGEKVDVAAHVYDQQKVSEEYLCSAATCSSPASYYYSCVCGKKGSTTFTSGETLDHVSDNTYHSDETNHWYGCVNCDAHIGEEPHQFSSEYEADETNHWHECKCGYKSGTEAHTFEWIVDSQPAYNRKGEKHEECTACHYKRNEHTEIDEETKDITLPYTSTARLDIDEDLVYGSEEYSVKVDNGGSDPKFYLTSKALSDFGTNDTLTFYIYGTGEAPFHFVTQDPWNTEVLATLAANTWNKVTLTKSQVELLVNQSSNYVIRIASWDSLIWHISNFVYSTSIDPHFSSNDGVFEINTDVLHGTDSYSVKLGGSGSDVRMYFEEELLTLMGDNDYLVFYIYGSSEKDINYIVNDPWSNTKIGVTEADAWAEVVVTKSQLEALVANPSNYWIRIAVWDSSQFWYVSEFSFTKAAVYEPHFTSNGVFELNTNTLYGEDSHSVKIGGTGSDIRMYFEEELLTLMGDNDYLLFSIYGTSEQTVNYIVNDPWSNTQIGTTKADTWVQIVVTKTQLQELVANPNNYWIRIAVWDSSQFWYVSEFSFAKEPTSLDFETNGNAYISNSFVHGDDTYSVLLSSGGSAPSIYFKDSVLTAMGDNTKLVFYVYSALSADHRFVVNDPWAPVALGTLSANTWNKVTLTKEQVAQIVGDKTNYWYNIQSWDCGGWYISEFSFEA